MKETRNFKVGYSKEMPRVWIDGAVLVQYGFGIGTMYTVDMKAGRIVLQATEEGTRKVTGRNPQMPIIDLRSKGMFEFINSREAELKAGTLRVDITFSEGRIVVKLVD